MLAGHVDDRPILHLEGLERRLRLVHLHVLGELLIISAGDALPVEQVGQGILSCEHHLDPSGLHALEKFLRQELQVAAVARDKLHGVKAEQRLVRDALGQQLRHVGCQAQDLLGQSTQLAHLARRTFAGGRVAPDGDGLVATQQQRQLQLLGSRHIDPRVVRLIRLRLSPLTDICDEFFNALAARPALGFDRIKGRQRVLDDGDLFDAATLSD